MSLDSDIALIGTGLAPLLAASHWIAQGRSVLILNPDFDFFLENSELPLDPLFKGKLKIHRVAQNLPEHTLAELRPVFPGSIEFRSENPGAARDFHDPSAPHVRSRARLWMDETGVGSDPALDDLYVQASDEGLHPQLLGAIQGKSRFPGVSTSLHSAEYSPNHSNDDRGLLIPRLCDIDLTRYRNGILEFLRERLGPERVICEASQIEQATGGLRFRHGGALRHAKIHECSLVFWTPRMTSWILNQAKLEELPLPLPEGIRFWEQWLLSSREPLSPDVVGIFNGELAVWADTEGAPDPIGKPIHTLSVLRAGEGVETNWASRASFDALSRLCLDFLKWDRFSVQSMIPRAILEWERPSQFDLGGIRVLSDCDGPVVRIARNVRVACEKISGPQA